MIRIEINIHQEWDNNTTMVDLFMKMIIKDHTEIHQLTPEEINNMGIKINIMRPNRKIKGDLLGNKKDQIIKN